MGNDIRSIDERVKFLENEAIKIRQEIINMCYLPGPERKAHPGPALSLADIMAVLYFQFMKLDPANPGWADRDRLILSKGHAAPVLYAALANKGFFEKSHLRNLRKVGCMLQGHPDMKSTPGVDMTSGSLGHGLSAGLGIALAARLEKRNYRVFVLLGDGECQEGIVWEAALAAGKYKTSNLIAIVDNNGFQSCDSVINTIPMEPLEAKWQSFGWHTMRINGHDVSQILDALDEAVNYKEGPSVIIAESVKGKGISFMENDNSWHQRALSITEYEQAMKELGVGQ